LKEKIMAPKVTLRLNNADNVVVARVDLAPGALVEGNVTAQDHVPAGHKVATGPIVKGEAVRKYDQIIGFASLDINPGDHVHVHNCAMGDFERDYAIGSEVKPIDYITGGERASFEGYVRSNGRVGTRNYIGVLTSVNCSASVARFIARDMERSGLLENYPGVDGVVALTHSTGCGMAGAGEGYENLQRVLWGHARHPNFAGILMVGLGCEVNQIDFLLEAYGIDRGPLFQTMNIQDAGGVRKTVDWGMDMVKEMLPEAAKAKRQTVSAEHLSVALQCGGSDGYSGITANPALGYAADLVTRHGGQAILAETPEIYGAEHLLTRRAVSDDVGNKLIERIKWWEDYTARNGGEMDNNPSPGNKKGGLTTILEKSLGAAAKGGTTNLAGVYKYGEPATAKGFVFMDSPGYDPASITGQVSSGANVVCFTTGRGSVYGNKPCPSIKLATNTTMYNKMSEDMDVNCGEIADGNVSVEEKGTEIFRKFLSIASGEPSKSEAQGLGDAEFIPWQVGAVM
jgi:altronate hydrolase